MTWRLAKSLIVLRDQVNAAYPNRNKASDGTIGDPNHQAEGSGSDHNPNKAGVVCAFDITHDPANGLDIVKLAQGLADSRDSRIKYLIRNKQIMIPSDYGWTWQPYSGANPHTSHLHVSVWGDYDNQNKWNITKGVNQMINDSDAEYERWALLGRHELVVRTPSRQEFREHAVGKSWLTAIETFHDSPEQALANHVRSLGVLSYQDNWEQQIKDRDQWVEELKKQLAAKPNSYVLVTEQLYKKA